MRLGYIVFMKPTIYEAEIVSYELEDSGREGFPFNIPMVRPYDLLTDIEPKRVRVPNILPTSDNGGGISSLPPIGTRCWVLSLPNSRYDQILTYTLSDAVVSSVFSPENVDIGGIAFKIGGINKSVIKLEPSGQISLYSNPEAFVNLNGSLNQLEISSDNITVYNAALKVSSQLFEEHPITKDQNVNVCSHLVAKREEDMMFSDWHLSLEETNPLAVSSSYNDKSVILAGYIFDNKQETGHVFQLETRQNTVSSTYKDTIGVIRLGYQKENKKYTNETTYPAGTLYEMAFKRVDPAVGTGSYSSFLERYGCLEGDTTGSQAESTRDEVYRFQIYEKVLDPIGIPIVDPLGAGKGWQFEEENNKAAFQYVHALNAKNIGHLIFTKMHNYTDHTLASVNTPTGIKYTNTIGNEASMLQELIFVEQGVEKRKLEISYDLDQFLVKNSQNSINLQEIYTKKDEFSLKIADSSKTYSIFIKNGKIRLDIDTQDTSKDVYIEISDDGKIYIGGKNGYGQELVTKAWIENYFNTHTHPTTNPGAPTLPPIAISVNSTDSAVSPLTYKTKIG